MKQLLIAAFFAATAFISQAQDMVVFQSNMRSKAANQFYEEEFRTVGTYKVKGNSYLLKGNNVSDIYTTLGFGVNIGVVFDTYNQQVAVMQEDKKSVVNLSFQELDSFYMKIDNDNKVKGPVMFRNMTKIDPSMEYYMQELVNGGKYKLYKSYYAEMFNASNNIAQTNLKEFEIKSDFYFVDYTTGGERKVVKIKSNLKSLKEYFKNNPAALKILSDYPSKNLEEKLTVLFETVNVV